MGVHRGGTPEPGQFVGPMKHAHDHGDVRAQLLVDQSEPHDRLHVVLCHEDVFTAHARAFGAHHVPGDVVLDLGGAGEQRGDQCPLVGHAAAADLLGRPRPVVTRCLVACPFHALTQGRTSGRRGAGCVQVHGGTLATWGWLRLGAALPASVRRNQLAVPRDGLGVSVSTAMLPARGGVGFHEPGPPGILIRRCSGSQIDKCQFRMRWRSVSATPLFCR